MNLTYIHKNGHQLGPFDDTMIFVSLNNRTFEYTDLCWREGWEDWKTIETIYPRAQQQSKSNVQPISETVELAPQGISYSSEEKAFRGSLPAIVKLAVRAIAELKFTIQNVNDVVGMVTFVTGFNMSSSQGAACSITFVDVGNGMYRAVTAGKQNLSGMQMFAPDFGSAKATAERVVSRMIQITGGKSPDSKVGSPPWKILLLVIAFCIPLLGVITALTFFILSFFSNKIDRKDFIKFFVISILGHVVLMLATWFCNTFL